MSCGQPIAADAPNQVDARDRKRRCTTCGAVQPHGRPRAAEPSTATPIAPAPYAVAAVGAEPRARFWLWASLVLAALVFVGVAVWRRTRGLDAGDSASAPAPVDAADERRVAKVRWSGRAVRVEGESVAPGAECEATASLVSDTRALVDAKLSIACGGKRVYEGVRSTGLQCSVHEGPAIGFGAWEYDLSCEGPSASGGRMRFDTQNKRASLEDTELGARIDLAIRRDDGVRGGVPLFAASVGVFRWRPERRYRARVLERSGDAPAELALGCNVRLTPNPTEDLPCRTVIRCGERIVYGGFGLGFMPCVVTEAEPTLALDDQPTPKDGDPALRLDIVNLRASLHDTEPTWRVELELTPE